MPPAARASRSRAVAEEATPAAADIESKPRPKGKAAAATAAVTLSVPTSQSTSDSDNADLTTAEGGRRIQSSSSASTVNASTLPPVAATPAKQHPPATAASAIQPTPLKSKIAATPSKAVPATPSKPLLSASSLPKRPPIATTDQSLQTAIERLFAKVDSIACGFAPTGTPLDVAGMYDRLSKSLNASDLGASCAELARFCARESKHQAAQQLFTLAGQYYKACKTFKHMEATMEGEGILCAMRQALTSATSLTVDVSADRERAEKLMASCQQQAPSATPVQVELSFYTTSLKLLQGMAHVDLQRALTAARLAQQAKLEAHVQSARGYWQRFLALLTQLNPLKQTDYTNNEITILSVCLTDVVEDFFNLLYLSQLLVRTESDFWSQLQMEVLTEEIATCCKISHDVHLNRWRLAKLLQMPQATAAQRGTWSAELQSLTASKSAVDCFHGKSVGTLLALQEHCFVSSSLHLSSADCSRLRDLVTAAMRRVQQTAASDSQHHYTPITSSEQLHAEALYHLCRAFIAAAQQDLYNCNHNAYQAFKRIMRAVTNNTTTPASSLLSSVQIPLPRFMLLVSFLRCLYLRGVSEEYQGTHKQASELFKTAMTTMDSVLYQHMNRSASGDCMTEEKEEEGEEEEEEEEKSESPSNMPPFASLLSGQLHRIRIQLKLDNLSACRQLVQEMALDSLYSMSAADLQQRLLSSVPFLAALGVHSPQLQSWRSLLLTETTDAEDLITQRMSKMKLSRNSNQTDNNCTTCSWYLPKNTSILFTPCAIDRLLSQLQSSSKSYTVAELEELLESQSQLRHPPVIRSLHHRLAAMYENVDIERSVYHLHQAMAITARHEVHAAHTKAESASPASSTSSSASSGRPRSPLSLLSSYSSELQEFQSTFLPALPASWTVCTIDYDGTQLLVSSIRRGNGNAAAAATAKKEPKKKAAATTRKKTTTTAPEETQSTGAAVSMQMHRLNCEDNSSVTFTSIRALFTNSLKQANEASQMSADYNSRLLPAAKAAGKNNKEKTREAKSVLDAIDPKRMEADRGIQLVCQQLEELLGDAIELLRANEPNAPVILIPSSTDTILPWENLPSLRQQLHCRMNSWTLMMPHLVEQSASLQKAGALPAMPRDAPGYYVLDPQNNLKKVENAFMSDLVERGWKGTCGASADVEALTVPWVAALQRQAYFVYVGHNGGQEFVPARMIREIIMENKPNNQNNHGGAGGAVQAVALQSGCSSALQCVAKEHGLNPLYEASGISLAYQQAKCPAMFGCLWPVTDDIDNWLKGVLQQIKDESNENSSNHQTLLSISLKSRDMCQKQFLNGASLVCYGLPVSV